MPNANLEALLERAKNGDNNIAIVMLAADLGGDGDTEVDFNMDHYQVATSMMAHGILKAMVMETQNFTRSKVGPSPASVIFPGNQGRDKPWLN